MMRELRGRRFSTGKDRTLHEQNNIGGIVLYKWECDIMSKKGVDWTLYGKWGQPFSLQEMRWGKRR